MLSRSSYEDPKCPFVGLASFANPSVDVHFGPIVVFIVMSIPMISPRVWKMAYT